MALRLAATFGSQERFRTALDRRACTVVTGFEPMQLASAGTAIGRLFLPKDWTSYAYAPRTGETAVLQLLRPTESGTNKITEPAIAHLEADILPALARPHPLMILLPIGARLSSDLSRALPPAIPLAPIDREIILALLAQTHSATGKIDRTLVAPLLPGDARLAGMDMASLMSALREPNAPAVACKLAALLAPMADASSDMTLEEIGGDSPAHQAAADIVSDLAAWRRGSARWSDLPHSLMLTGAPGTGKSVLARAIAATAGVPIVEATLGNWQSAGHLGDMLREMRRSFAQAIRQKQPSVLFIDEIDAAGSRVGKDQHNANYRANVIDALLTQIDQLTRAEGVILIAATNHPEAVDPAILRPGRFDLHLSLPLPTQAQIRHMLHRALPEERPEDLAALALAFSGQTPAAIDARLRAARAAARRAGDRLTARALRAMLHATEPGRAGYDRRIAVHECGHAIVATLLGAVPVRRMQIAPEGGSTSRASAIHEGTAPEFEDELTIILAGRAAERLLLGSISAGAGGSADSDLAQASALQLQFDREFGLGCNGNAWLGEPDMQQLSSDDRDRLRAKLDQFERRARALLAPHRDLIERLADHLRAHRDLDETALAPWLSDIAADAAPTAPS
ncbi:ATP-dependent Zn protease [Rhodobacter aestuarii]|uniref:ATP-dependent Zn proteases n=1 Tax=Rhodobacter aestuarii TaxID=453582 RepID=A0A1N7QIX0_9RHOB|nr:AAA family ATPase [Rhodobacter aestuarii]PTV93204.1 ATP-dependent Zn protease [Rhodobacter aestuarii]SIT22736.1 ATP-dependent Zn proteases [Rhodobacter aestuarii]